MILKYEKYVAITSEIRLLKKYAAIPFSVCKQLMFNRNNSTKYGDKQFLGLIVVFFLIFNVS
jgi:hypothetical protein